MFRHEGPSRSPRKNAQLAGYLAAVAGFVNSSGFVLVGSFTSHVTGSVGRFSDDLARGDASAALFAGLLVVGFFAGALVSSVLLESVAQVDVPRAYAAALLLEACTLFAFVLVAVENHATHARALDAEAAILSAAMGMQNGLVTRLSGAVVRTTHLTGVVTDLGIELARWLRQRRRHATGPAAVASTRVLLLAIIFASFVVGAVVGALLAMRLQHFALLVPVLAVAAASGVAFRSSATQT